MRATTPTLAVPILLATLAGCWTPENDADPEPPARKKAEEAPDPNKPVANAWPPEQAARLTYDPTADRFALTNVSPHFICYLSQDGEARRTYERQLPDGKWVRRNRGCCNNGTSRLVAVPPGRQVTFAWLDAGSLNRELEGEDAMPARVCLYVTCPPAKVGG